METDNTKIEKRVKFLQEFSLFDTLTKDEFYLLAQKITSIQTKRHSFIYHQGDPCDGMYLLAGGTVKVGMYSDDDKEVIKSLVHPTAIFGEWDLSEEGTRNEFAKAMDKEVLIFKVEFKDFKALMKANFEFCLKVVNLFSRRARNAERRLESLIVQDARTRIIEFLKENAQNFGHQVGFEMLLKHSLTQQDIANFTGTSRQTVTTVFNDLKKTNQIHFKRKSILIRNVSDLC